MTNDKNLNFDFKTEMPNDKCRVEYLSDGPRSKEEGIPHDIIVALISFFNRLQFLCEGKMESNCEKDEFSCKISFRMLPMRGNENENVKCVWWNRFVIS